MHDKNEFDTLLCIVLNADVMGIITNNKYTMCEQDRMGLRTRAVCHK